VGYEILYCSRCQAQLRGREFERGDAFRIEDQAVCKTCAPEVVKSLPPDKVQILLKQMVAQGKAPPKTARSSIATPLPSDRMPGSPGAASRVPSLTPLWVGLGAILVLVLGLGVWVIGGFGHPPPAPPKAEAPAPRPPLATTPPREPVAPPAPSNPPPKVKEPPQGQSIPGLVGHWTLDEGRGSSAADSSGIGSPGTLLDGPAWVPGKLGTALSFNGDKAVLNVQSNDSLKDLRKSGLSVCAWIFPRAAKRGHLVDKSNANMGWYLSFKSDSKIQFGGDQYFNGELTRFSSKPLASTAWHHVAATWDGDRSASNAHVYVDGVLDDGQGNDGVGALREGSSPTLSIGNRRTQDRGFDGVIDDVRVYNRVLAGSEILRLAGGTPK
jgi:hypothetical protein